MLKPPVEKLLAGDNFAQLATVNPDNTPHSDTVWFEYKNDQIIVATTARTRKAKNLRHNNQGFIVVTHRENPYEQAQITVTLSCVEQDNEMLVCDRIAKRYTGKHFPQRHHAERVALYFDIVKVKYHIAKV